MSPLSPPHYAGRAGVRALLAGIFGLLGACDSDSVAAAAPRHNVLWVVVDTLRADRVGPRAGAEIASLTPNLDHLGARGVVFEQAFANAPWTKPSVATLFTSLHTGQHLVHREETTNRLAASLPSAPAVLQAAGYRTAAFSQNPHVHPALGFAHGFDRFEAGELWQVSPDAIAEAGLRWLAETDDGRPFLLYLHFLDPHDPYGPRDLVAATAEHPETAHSDAQALAATHADPLNGGLVSELLEDGALRAPLDTEDVAHLARLYDEEVQRVDAAVGRLLGSLESTGSADDTVVLVTADHGEEFMEHGTLLHGYHLFDEALHVPLVVAAPGLEAGRSSDLVSHLDVAPTLLDAVGLDAPESFRGRSLLAVLRGDEPAEDFVVSHTIWKGLERFSVRTTQWKYIRDEKLETDALYDLTRDPGELANVALAHPTVVEQLRRAAAVAREPVPGFLAADAFGEADETVEERLQELGYTDR